jgi:hypothetical protein
MGAYREQPIIARLTIGVPIGGLAHITGVDLSITAGAPLVELIVTPLTVGAFAPIGDEGILPVQRFPAPVAIVSVLRLRLESLRLKLEDLRSLRLALSRARELEGYGFLDEAASAIVNLGSCRLSAQGSS